MRFRVLAIFLILIALIASACGVIISHFMNVFPFSVDGCTVHVIVTGRELVDYQNESIFFGDPFFRNGLNMQTLYDVTLEDDLHVDFHDIMRFEGIFNVAQYTFVDDQWNFQILGDGNRTVTFIESLFAGPSDINVKDITDVGWIWVDGHYVHNFIGSILRCEETDEIIDVTDPNGESVSRLYMCEVELTERTVPGRVGPGEDRAIRAYIDNSRDGFAVSGRATDNDGNKWYELIVPRVGYVWAPASLTTENEHGFVRDHVSERTYLNDCTDGAIPEKYVPIVPGTRVDGEPASETVGCDEFTRISPVRVVPTGNATFSWAAVTDANEYLVMFYDYTGAFAAQHSSPTNSLTINTGSIPTGSEFTWEVYALLNGDIICRTSRSDTIIRAAQEVIVVETEEPTPKPKKKKKGGGGYTPPSE